MRRSLLITIAMLLTAILLWVTGRAFQAPTGPQDPWGKLINHIDPQQDRGVLMEFAKNPAQVRNLLGDPRYKPDAEIAPKNQDTMRTQQYLDVVFILLYWAFFVFVAGGPLRRSEKKGAQRLGRLLAIAITIAAMADYVEDAAILHVLGNGAGSFWPYPFGVAKWALFFLALGLSAPLFLRYPKLGHFQEHNTRWTRWGYRAAGWVFLAAAVAGALGAIIVWTNNEGALLMAGNIGILAGFALFLVALIGDAVVNAGTAAPAVRSTATS